MLAQATTKKRGTEKEAKHSFNREIDFHLAF